MRFLPMIALLFAMPGCASEPKPENNFEPQEEAIAAIEQLSGQVKFDVQSADYPVIEVFFNNTNLTDKNLLHLRGFTKLQSLSLWHTKVTDSGLTHLKHLTNLRTLTLDETRITDAGLLHLKGLTKLEGLYLFKTKVTDSGLGHLKGLTKLQKLDLTNTSVTEKGVQMLQTALPNCAIAGLTEQSIASLTETEKQAIAAIKKLGGRVRYNTFNRERKNRKVIEVNFGHLGSTTSALSIDTKDTLPNLSDDELKHVKGLSKLKRLILSSTDITDDGLEHLRGLTKLQSLSLGGTKVTDGGLKHLKGLTELSYLGLRGTDVSDAGLKHLQSLVKLQRLCLIDTNVTDEGVKTLQTAIPNCNISHKASLPSLLLPGTEVSTTETDSQQPD